MVYDVPQCNVIFFSGNMILFLLSYRLGEIISEIGSTVVQLPLYSLSRKKLICVCLVRSTFADDFIKCLVFFQKSS